MDTNHNIESRMKHVDCTGTIIIYQQHEKIIREKVNITNKPNNYTTNAFPIN